MKIQNPKLILRFALSFCVLIFAFYIPDIAEAAALYFSPSSGYYNVGEIIPVSVYVSSEDAAMNAASGVINFSKEKLEVVSLSKSGSIFSLWVQEPTFSNDGGTVNFEGIVLNPGFSGKSGKIITVNFRAKMSGSASLNFSSGAVLANDGNGTNILKNLSGAEFNLSTPESVPVLELPKTPEISSPTHPDQNKWYPINKAKFSWKVPDDITAIRMLYNKYPDSQPNILYDSNISEKETENLKDGVYYFHLQFKNQNGWGKIAHFRFQIDTEPPSSLSMELLNGKETTNPSQKITIQATDTLSGISYYKIKIPGKEPITVFPEEIRDKPFTIEPQKPGKYTIEVEAFDGAGNHAAIKDEYTILPIEPPKITDYPETLQSGSILSLKGAASPNSKIEIYIKNELDKSLIKDFTKSDDEGNWSYFGTKPLAKGNYKIFGELTNAEGAKSGPSNEITVKVIPFWFIKIGNLIIEYKTVLGILIVIIILLILWIFIIWKRTKKTKINIKKEIAEAEKHLHEDSKKIKEELKEEIGHLDGKSGLNEKEKLLYEQIKEKLKETEELIESELKKIEKDIEKRK